MSTHPDQMPHSALVAHMLRSVEAKLAAAMEAHGVTSYAAAKALVQPHTTAGPAVWAILDAKYTHQPHPAPTHKEDA